jgi:Mrp family chromosome partitioning ATPase
MSPANLPQNVEATLVQSFRPKDPQVQVRVRRNSLGWFRLEVISRIFEKKESEERKQQVNTALAALHLHLEAYPFSNYQLMTPEEAADSTAISPVHMPLWSEILLAPEPDEDFGADDHNETTTIDEKPFVVTFYSFKGGVGRSTSLAFVANILVSYGLKVVMIDFDLEAPGLSFACPAGEQEATACGALDYIYQRYLTPDENVPLIDDCIRQIVPKSIAFSSVMLMGLPAGLLVRQRLKWS